MSASVQTDQIVSQDAAQRRRITPQVLLFSLTILLGSALLFFIEPMLAKLLLPKLGGSPAVWNTCMVFFQSSLLAGYAYAHFISQRLTPRQQGIVQLVVICLPLMVLPVALPRTALPPVDTNPIPWVLLMLSTAVGLPFFALSTNSPLMQQWFAGGSSDHDPYFLYAASNVGSMVALLAYPVIVEPLLSLHQQTRIWSVAYVAWILLTLMCAIVIWRRPRVTRAFHLRLVPAARRESLRWCLLAFVPSSYLLGVTTFITSDIAAVPLLWIVPLAIYLLSFILTFASRPPISHRSMVFALPMALLAVVIFTLSHSIEPAWLILTLHLLGLFIVSMVCHGELARTRPPAGQLTYFYLMLSIGGVLGGIFNAIMAPLIFSRTLEYPIAILLACALVPPRSMFRAPKASRLSEPLQRKLDWILPLALLGITFVMIRTAPKEARAGNVFLRLAPSAILCIAFVERRNRFTLGMGALIVVIAFALTSDYRLLEIHRSFFGVHRIVRTEDSKYIELLHGTTIHGRQMADPITAKPIAPDLAMSYYTASGPAGQILNTLPVERAQDIGVVGLGSGSLAAHIRPGVHLRYFEIDPVVGYIAQDSERFTFIDAARDRGADVRIILGDARLTLANVEDASLDALFLDAFSGDAIPVHLLTREAMQLYVQKLKPRGVLAIHISNIFIDLKPVVANAAASANCVSLLRGDYKRTGEPPPGWNPSEWVAVARTRQDLAFLPSTDWLPLPARGDVRLWTDDYSNILKVFRWRH